MGKQNAVHPIESNGGRKQINLVESQLNFLEITINGFEPKNNCC